MELIIDTCRHAQELRETWQAKLLLGSQEMMAAVVLSVLAHSFDEAMPTLLRVVFPGFRSITAPFFCSAGRILKSGDVAADMVTRDGQVLKNVGIFRSTRAMEGAFRRLADRLRLDDADRAQLFIAVKNWVVCDYRIDPSMNPADPDARRLVH
jgi:hypothetical protein